MVSPHFPNYVKGAVMAEIIYSPERCKGCHYCVKACPKDVITLSKTFNSKGYEIVQFDERKCIGCGSCYTVCPDYAIIVKKEA